jgi:hypothetical protein
MYILMIQLIGGITATPGNRSWTNPFLSTCFADQPASLTVLTSHIAITVYIKGLGPKFCRASPELEDKRLQISFIFFRAL